jgi:hypothetical protein
MIDANAYTLATNWALHEIESQIRDSDRREKDFQTSDLRSEAKRYLNDHPEMLAQAETMIASRSAFASLRKKGPRNPVTKTTENQRR